MSYVLRSTISELYIKLERSRAAIRKLSDTIGTTFLTSSNDASDDDLSMKSNEVEQHDNEFGMDFTYTTNVGVEKYMNISPK